MDKRVTSDAVPAGQRASLIGGLRSYPELRETGLSWLPRVPAHWEMWRNGRLFGPRRETGYPDLPILEVSLRSGVRVRDMETGRKQQMADRSKYLRAREGDIAYNMMRMWQGAVGVVPTDGLVSPAYVVARPFAEAHAPYHAYLFRTAAYMGEVDNYSRGIVKDRNRLYWESFKQIVSAVPPLDEQRAIVRFLDWHGSLTAKLVRAKRRLIALLNERKQAIVHRAVTRGLDPNARLVPSGVPWLGDIPEGWRTAPAMLLFDEKLTRNKGMIEKTVLSLSYGRLVVKPEEKLRGLVPESFETYQVVEPGEIIIRTTDLQNDQKSLRVGLCATRGIITSAYLCLKPRSSLTSEFAYLVLHSYDVSKLFYSLGSGVRQNLGFNDIKRVPFPVPPVEQQQVLCEAVAQATRDINQAIDQSTRELSLLEELRARLVADVITGQLDVRTVAATLPEIGAPELGSKVADADEERDFDAEGDVEEAA
jgi:type I restriction enzyme, S subunit